MGICRIEPATFYLQSKMSQLYCPIYKSDMDVVPAASAFLDKLHWNNCLLLIFIQIITDVDTDGNCLCLVEIEALVN